MKTFLLLILLAATATALEQAQHAYVIPGKVGFEWQFHDETRAWLEVRSFNSRDFPGEGFNPSYTEIVVKPEYRPKLRKLSDGRWAISFMSEVAADLP